MDYAGIAKKWRLDNAETHPQMLNTGLVLIWEGSAYAWRDKIRDASTERPNVIAVDIKGRCFRAEGGDDDAGAKVWVVV